MNAQNALRRVVTWVLPAGLQSWVPHGIRARFDINETVSPTQLRHVRRYEFARRHAGRGAILDAACGCGFGSDVLEPLDQYVGIDYADYCIEYAKSNYGGENRRFIMADIYGLDRLFASQSFDTIVSFETLEHLERPEEALGIFLRLLKPQGRLIASLPLNHPDRIYHKRQYTHADARALVGRAASWREFTLQEHLQTRLGIAPLAGTLPVEHKGNWVGVLSVGG